MKLTFYKALIFVIFLVFVGNRSFAQVPDGVVSSLKSGNASSLAQYFNQNIQLEVLDQDDVYSKAQAQQIIANFFNQYKAQDYSVMHESGKEGAKYAIGTLTTDKGFFRVTFYFKTEGEKAYIHQIRIEKQ